MRNCIPQPYLTYLDEKIFIHVNHLDIIKRVEAMAWDTMYRDLEAGITFCDSFDRIIKLIMKKLSHEEWHNGGLPKSDNDNTITFIEFKKTIRENNYSYICKDIESKQLSDEEREQFNTILSSGISCMRKYQKDAMRAAVIFSHRRTENKDFY